MHMTLLNELYLNNIIMIKPTWNEYDDAFDTKVLNGKCRKLFSYDTEPFTIELKPYIED